MASDKEESYNSNLITEWQAARTILLETDGRLLDLRKFGFSVLTGLLAASSFLLPSTSLTGISGNSTAFPETIKFAVLAVLLVLISAFQMLDRNFQVLQQAAATRAMVIERDVDLELTEIISNRYSVNWVSWFMVAVYGLYSGAVLVLGIFVLQSHDFYFWTLVCLTLLVIVITIILTKAYNASFPCGKIDWAIDRTQCTAGDRVAITLTNFDEKNDITFSPGDILWQVMKEGKENVKIDPQTVTSAEPVHIKANDSFTWLWKTPNEEGIYRIERAVHPEKNMHPPELVQLQRKVRVKSKPEKKQVRIAIEES
jgi:hypothetical protein